MSEHTEQAGFFQWCENHERYHPGLARFFAVPNGGHRRPGVAGKLRAEGVRAGICDVLNLTWSENPHLSDEPNKGYTFYKGLVFEFKSATGRLSAEQRDWCDHFREQGYRVEVPRSWIQAALITIDYFGLPEKLKDELPLHRVKEQQNAR